MLDRTQVSLICPRNDLESATILDIAQRFGLHCLEVHGGWGLTFQDALAQYPDLDALRPEVITVELSGEAAADLIRAHGKRLYSIDHHHYTAGAKAASLSPLEQFSALVGHTLSREEQEVAIADRDFFPGLSRAGVPWERALELRRGELAVRDAAELMEEARALVLDQAWRRLGGLSLLNAPVRLADVLLEAAQTPAEAEYTKCSENYSAVELPKVLALFYDDDDSQHFVAVRYGGPAWVRPALKPLLSDPAFTTDLTLWMGGGVENCFFCAAAKTAFFDASLSALMSRLLALLLGTDRPLAHYGCTFLLPLDLYEDDDLARNPAQKQTPFRDIVQAQVEAGSIKRHRATLIEPGALQTNPDESAPENDGPALETQARLYFLAQLRDVLFDVDEEVREDLGRRSPGLSPIQRWRLPTKKVRGMRWRLYGTKGGEEGPETLVKDVSLYRYFNGLYLFAMTVEPSETLEEENSTNGLTKDRAAWWCPLFDAEDDSFACIARLRFDNWLRFTKHARILFPSFIEQLDEEKFDVQELVRPDGRTILFHHKDGLSPIILDLLADFLVLGNPKEGRSTGELKRLVRLQYLQEDRMAVNCAYALAGPAPADEAARAEAERLFSLALYVDKDSDTFRDLDGYVYDSRFTRQLMCSEHRLDRWIGLGTYLGYCPYANAYMGYGGFFTNVVAREHVPYHYQRMLIQALFYQLTLRNYNRRITHATNLLVKDTGRDPGQYFRDLREGFIKFTNSYWFHEVTLAIQGKEIFGLQTKALDLDREYDLIKDEMERADEYVQSVRDRVMNEKMAAAGWIASLLAVAALAVTAFDFDKSFQHLLFWPSLLLVVLLSVGIYCRHVDAQRRCTPRRLLCCSLKAIRRLVAHQPAKEA